MTTHREKGESNHEKAGSPQNNPSSSDGTDRRTLPCGGLVGADQCWRRPAICRGGKPHACRQRQDSHLGNSHRNNSFTKTTARSVAAETILMNRPTPATRGASPEHSLLTGSHAAGTIPEPVPGATGQPKRVNPVGRLECEEDCFYCEGPETD